MVAPLHKSTATMLVALLLAGCGAPAGDDDDSAPLDDDDANSDDDDSTPPPAPLADVIGVFNLTNVVQAQGVSYVDFSGGFGTFAATPDDVLSVGAYLGTFSYGAEAPYWRVDLGAYPIPVLGTFEIVDMDSWYPWEPTDQIWWDGGPRIGAGNYLTSRLDLTSVSAYQVDDPVSPGAAGWTAGGSLTWASEGGLDVIDFVAVNGIALPEEVAIVAPTGAAPTWPAAHPLPVQWSAATDGSYVTVTVLNDTNVAYVAHAPDTGEHVISASVLHDEFGAGTVELIVARNLQTPLAHPQGDVLVRAREERRTSLRLLPDVVLTPAYGEAGQDLTLEVSWFTADLSDGFTLDLGQSVAVTGVTQTGPYTADVAMKVGPDAAVGPRDVSLSTPGGESVTVSGGFTVLDLIPSDDCTTADAAPPLEADTYTSTTAGLSNDYGSDYACLAWSLNGADAVYRVEMEAGQTLAAALDMPEGDGALALLSDCGGADSAVACADQGLSGDPETLAFTATEDGTWYLVVDAWTSGGGGSFSGPFSLTLSLERDVIEPDWITPGSSRSFTLLGEAPWDAGIVGADIELGDGLGIDAVAPGAVPSELDFLATADPGAVPGARTISVDNGPSGTVTFTDALWVTGWPIFDSCSEALAVAPWGPGSATGYAVQTSNTIAETPCMPYPSSGPEVLVPFDWTAGTVVSASVTLPTEDAQLYILSDCGDPTACFDDAAVDATLGGQEESIVGWAVPTTGRYYLVVDVYGGLSDPLTPWQFDLSVSAE